MRVLAATIFPLLFLALARILLDAYYQYIDRPELFAQNQSQDLLFNGMLWLVLTLVILWFMGIQVRVQLAVPVTVSIAIALWSLTIDVSPEHRDWDESGLVWHSWASRFLFL